MNIRLTCPYCGFSKEVSQEKIPKGAKRAVCPKCKQKFQIFSGELAHPDRGAQEDGYQEEPRRGPSPWEQRSEIGLWNGIWLTVKQVLLGPDKLFARLHHGVGQGEPLAFGLLIGSVGSMLSFFWQVVMVTLGIVSFGPPMVEQFGLLIIFVVLLVMVPLFVFISLYVYSAILHLFLIIVRAANKGFEATFRVVCFSQATQLLGIIPFLGGWISGLWQLVVQVIGLKEIHETSYPRIIIAFLMPIVIIMLIVVAVLIPLVILFLKNPSVSNLFPFDKI